METLLTLDRDLFLELNGLGSLTYDPLWLLLSHKLTNVVIYLTAALYLYFKANWKVFLLVLAVTSLLILAADQTANLFKAWIARPRPCHDPEIGHLVRLVKTSCGGTFGFFSAHASNSFALAIFFGLSLKIYNSKFTYLLVLSACLVAYSRIYLGVHYPLDILAGALCGVIYGFLFYRFAQRTIYSRLR